MSPLPLRTAQQRPSNDIGKQVDVKGHLPLNVPQRRKSPFSKGERNERNIRFVSVEKRRLRRSGLRIAADHAGRGGRRG